MLRFSVLVTLLASVMVCANEPQTISGTRVSLNDGETPDDSDEEDDELLGMASNTASPASPPVDYDEDEFEGIPSRPSKSADSLKSASRSSPKQQQYYLEMGAILFLVVYIINFFVGYRVNNSKATLWFSVVKPLYEEQFAWLGFSPRKSPGSNEPLKKESLLHKESFFTFKLYATGRRHCTGLLATLDMRRRQDLFSLGLSLVYDQAGPSHDTVTIEVPMNDANMESFVFCICKRKQARTLKKNHTDLGNYASTCKSKKIPDSFVVLTDAVELLDSLLPEAVCKVLSKFEDHVELLHFTDQGTVPFSNNAKVLRMSFRLPDHPEDVLYLTKFTVFCVDLVAGTQLSANAKHRARERRRAVAEKLHKQGHKERQEALAAKKAQLKKREAELKANNKEKEMRATKLRSRGKSQGKS